MRQDQEVKMSARDIFGKSQETYSEAKKKSAEESGGNKTKRFDLSKDGKYSVRMLPLAPVIDSNGKMLPLDRKGYEYPSKEMWLNIEGGKDKDGKPKNIKLPVCNVKYAFPKLDCDLIEVYTDVACELNAKDEALCKKIKSSSYDGGLKWSFIRGMYVLDKENREEGPQLLSLSFSQYKELEDAKIDLWEKLMGDDDNVPCPITSLEGAYFVEIKRKTENKKTSYSFNIDTVGRKCQDDLSEEELETLLNTPRLPEVLYRYTRYHLEATIAFLNQYDQKLQINTMSDPRIAECIEKIKLSLPASDNSHFNINGSGNDSAGSGGTDASSIDALWDTFDKLFEDGLDDNSDEGRELRAAIREFIEEKELNIRVARGKSNEDLLKEIDEVLAEGDDAPAEEPAKQPQKRVAATTSSPAQKHEEPEGQGDDEPEEPEEETQEARRPSRTQRNDDTQEPAARGERSRRTARPARR